MTGTLKAPAAGKETIDLDRIRPGMSADEMQRVREEIVRVASQTLKDSSNTRPGGRQSQTSKEKEWQQLLQQTSLTRL